MCLRFVRFDDRIQYIIGGAVNRKSKISIICVFVAIECVLYALFLADDFGGVSVGANVALKYSTVALAFMFVLANFLFVDRRDKHDVFDNLLLALAFALTLVSDWFLLVQGEHYEVGVTTFIGAQLCHFARIERTKIWLICSAAARVLLSVVAIIVLAAFGELNALYALVAIYFVQLVGNFVESVVWAVLAKDKRTRTQAIVLSVGFLLFIGCDISVGLANLYGVAGECEWLFYTPSQVLIALSLGRIYETESH